MANGSGDPIPAIPEHAAEGEIDRLFAEIRFTLGVPVVNLIWRHLATFDGALAWTWNAVKPLYLDGTILAQSAALRGEMEIPAATPWRLDAFDAQGLGPSARAGILGVLASYDRSNTMNLIALSALLLRMEGAPASEAAMPAATPLAETEPVLPRLLGETDVERETWKLVLLLNAMGERSEEPILASMYRHLAHWPAYLRLALRALEPLHESGELANAIASNLGRARKRAAGLAARLDPQGALPAESLAATHAAVATFTEHPIGKMVTICRFLRSITPFD